jgi:hypothetical protein
VAERVKDELSYRNKEEELQDHKEQYRKQGVCSGIRG